MSTLRFRHISTSPEPVSIPLSIRLSEILSAKTYPEILQGFHELEWKQRFRLQHGSQNPQTSAYRVERSMVILERNRYGNVQPWDASRIRLKNPIGGSDYVNASPITLKSRTKTARSSTSTPVSTSRSPSTSPAPPVSRYIATQGPKEGQYSLFWHMVMQETPGDVGVVVMLTPHVEGSKEKCAQYYPATMENPTIILPAHENGSEEEEGEPGPTDDGDPFLDSHTGSADTDSLGIDSDTSQSSMVAGDDSNSQEPNQSGSVTLLSLEYDANTGCDVRKLRLTIGDSTKTIYHYFYGAWPDFARPESDDRTALLELTRASKAMADDAPRIVHCSAGVGRTGTWIALDFLLQELEAGRLVENSSPSSSQASRSSTPQSLPQSTYGKSGPPKSTTPDPKDEEDLIWETVNALREQRMMMVMNDTQFSFIYEVLKEAFFEKYTEKETGPVVIEVREPSPKVARKASPWKDDEGLDGGGVKAGELGRDAEGGSDAEEGGGESEAETELMDHDQHPAAKTDEDNADMDDTTAETGEHEEEVDIPTVDVDPYAAVAPETIREQQRKDERGEQGGACFP